MAALPDESVKKGLDAQVREGAFSAVMQGSGESYLSAFAVHLHATPLHIGVLAALPPIVGTAVQLLSVKVLSRLGRRRPLIVAGAAAQAATWLPLFLLPTLIPSAGAWTLIACVGLYHAAGHLAVPAWNSLITDLVDDDQRGAYFAKRAKIIALSSFLALALSGVVLHASETWLHPVWGFGLIFVVAASARGISTGYLAELIEVPAHCPQAADGGVREFLRSRRSALFRRFLLFSSSFHLATMVAGPFFVVYLLRDLELSYVEYGLWMAAPIVGQLLTLQEWGRLADTFGNTKVLTVTGLLIPLLPVLYLVSPTWWAVCVINLFSGMIWPGFSLSLSNYVFDVVRPEDRAKGVAVYNAANALGAAAGALLGSGLAMIAPSRVTVLGWTLTLASGLPLIFLASGVLRLMVSVTLLKTLRERRSVTPITHLQLVRHLPVIRPMWAAISPSAGRPRIRR